MGKSGTCAFVVSDPVVSPTRVDSAGVGPSHILEHASLIPMRRNLWAEEITTTPELTGYC